MSRYKHGISTSRRKTQMPKPAVCKSMVQVVIGTAPINTLADPKKAVNTPILLETYEDAEKYIGHTNDMEKYTIMHSVYASFKKHKVAPIVVINVLDPDNEEHLEAVAGEDVPIVKGVATVEKEGILRDKVTVSVSDSDTVCEAGTDYVTSFDAENGYLKIGVIDGGKLKSKEKLHIAYSMLKPEAVTPADIIGGVDENYVKTGVEVIDDVYPMTKVIPTIGIAPMFSKNPAVALALESKIQKVYGKFNGIAFTDLDSSSEGADTYAKVGEVKEKNVPSSRFVVPCWPMVLCDGMKFAKSAFDAALLQSVVADHNNIPSCGIDNENLLIDGICTEDGTQVNMTQDDVNDYLNAYGVVGAINLPEWKAWGNNTAAYPQSEDPIDRWIASVTMLNYLENKFKNDYLSKIGRNATYKMIEGIVGDFNMSMNSLVPDHLAGAEIIFDKSENPIENLLNGHLKFHTRYASYIPTEYIENEFEYVVDILQNALEGGE